MCYTYRQKATKKDLLNIGVSFSEEEFDFPVLNGFAYPKAPAIVSGWNLEMMEWGFIPNDWRNMDEVWKHRKGFNDPAGKWVQHSLLNAKGEEISNKMYRQSAKDKRCLILATGFFESRFIFPVGTTGKDLSEVVRYPYFIRLKEQQYFFFAGIYNTWTDEANGETKNTFALLTTEANSLMAEINNFEKRMPVILAKAEADIWLRNDLSENVIAELAVTQYPAELMDAWTVSKNKRAENAIGRVIYPELLSQKPILNL